MQSRFHARLAGLVAGCGSVLLALPAWAARPDPWQMGMQEPASPTARQIQDLNDILNVIIIGITLLVFALLAVVIVRFRAGRNPEPAKWTHNTKLEVAWTTLPVLLLLIVAFPSFKLLYAMDRIEEADLTLKVTGHQWYWSYEYPDQQIGFDSIMLPPEETPPDEPRLLAVDNRVVLPVGVNVRILLTADDVIHSWAVPALGIKTDTVPGRLNETWVRIDRPGVYYGQCSELCGVNHGFMPIAVEALPPEQFEAWLAEARQKFALNQDRPAAIDVASAD